LLSDPEKAVLTQYDMFGEKKMYGRSSMGIIRSTVVIDASGKVEKIFRNVKAAGHAQKVLDYVRGA
jgi:peroxiredoxin Q/BCP